MPFNGSGTYNRDGGATNWQDDAAAGTKIRADLHDQHDQDIANALSNAITRDGQSPATANIPMGGFKITNLGLPTATTDAASKTYVDTSTGRARIGDTPPASPVAGDLWWESDSGNLYCYYNDGDSLQWVQINTPQINIPPLTKWETIAIRDVVATTDVQFTNLGAYRQLRLTGWLRPAAATNIGWRTSTNNGTSYDQGATDYYFHAFTASNTAMSVQGVTGTTYMPLNAVDTIGNVANWALLFDIQIEQFNKATEMHCQQKVSWYGGTGVPHQSSIFAMRNNPVARNALGFVMTTTTGYFHLEGVRG
jgi:hypothetical protein